MAQIPFTMPDMASFYTFLDSFDHRYPSDTLEGGYYNQMQRIRLTWGSRLAPDGNMRRAHRARTDYVRAYPITTVSGSNFNTQVSLPLSHPNVSDWEELGHTSDLLGDNKREAKGMGQIHRLAFHPQFGVSNQTIYAGSHYGGLFRSDDDGQNWYNYHTDRGLPLTSVGGVAASATHVYVCTGNGDYGFSSFGADANYQPNQGNITNYNPIHTQGVYRCSHGASGPSAWTAINGQSVTMLDGSTRQDLLEVFEAGGTMRELIIHPSNASILLIATSQGIFRTANGGQTWQQVLLGPPTAPDSEWRGLVFHPTNPNIVYASGQDVYRSNDAGVTWTSMTNGLQLHPNALRVNLAVTPAAPDRLYAYVKIPTDGVLYVYDSTGWSLQATNIHPYVGWTAIAVSPIYPNVVHFGGEFVRVNWKVLQSGNPMNISGSIDADRSSIHYDTHVLHYPPNGDTTIYAATHGGVSKKVVGNVRRVRNWTNLYNGLAVSTVWAFDDWEGNPDFLITANQDVGANHTYDRGQVWYSDVDMGDGYSVRINDQDGTAYIKGNDYEGLYQTDPERRPLRSISNYDGDNQKAFSAPFENYDFSQPGDFTAVTPIIPHNVFPAKNHPKTDSFYLGFTELYLRYQTQLSTQQWSYLHFLTTEAFPGYIYDVNWNPLSTSTSAPRCSSRGGTVIGLDTLYYGPPLPPLWHARIDSICLYPDSAADYGQIYSQLWGEPCSDLYQHQPISLRRRIMEIAFSEDAGTDYTYLATLGDISNHKCGFYFNDRAIHCDTCFIDLTDSIPYDASIVGNLDPNPITGIAVDPLDGNRVWISLSGYSQQLKVLYSQDAGRTWTTWDDTDNALANLNVPINNIVYQRGTNDRLYIATDVGVYVREGQGAWLRYGENFPNVRVTELKINYCVGKLRAATFGRGVWENDLLPAEEAISYRSFRTISGQQTWSATKHMSRDLRILSGAQLILDSMTLNMPKNGLIVIEPGGKLIVDGSTITNACGQVWQGIQVWGQTDEPQDDQHQGVLVVQNGSVVEHAREAVSPWQVGNFPKPDGTGGTGGIVRASDSEFRNNWRSVGFMQYRGATYEQSIFDRCTFAVDTTIRQGFLGHISAWDVSRLRIQGCTFEDARTSRSGNGYGVYSLEASIHLRPSFQGGIAQQSHFEGLARAVEIGSTPSRYSWVVDQTTFDHNWRGIINRAGAFVRLIRNDFTLSPYPNQFESYGIGLLRQVTFIVEQNTIEVDPTTPNAPSIGIWVDDTKGGYNRLRNNDFERTTLGIYVNGDNGFDGINRGSGLQFWCNGFIANAYDFSLFADGQPALVGDNQGSTNEPAKNTFSYPLSSFNGQDWHMHNDGSGMLSVNYWVPQNPSTIEVPIDTINTDVFNALGQGNVNFCADYYTNTNQFSPQDGNTSLTLQQLKQSYYTAMLACEEEEGKVPVDSAEVAIKAQEVTYWASEVVFYYQNDTLGPHPDSTLAWLQKIPGLLTQYAIVGHYWKQGLYTDALSYLNTIPANYTLTAREQSNHDDYSLLKDMLHTAYQDNRNEALLEEIEVEVLRNIADGNHGFAALYAANIINFFYVHEYTYLPTIPEVGGEEKLLNLPEQEQTDLQVYPNPSRTWAAIRYSLPKDTEKGRLVVTSTNGQIIVDQLLDQPIDQISLITRDWHTGVYFVAIIANEVVQHRTTLVIRR